MSQRMWRISVVVPADKVTDDQQNALFKAVADAAYAWEPAEREAWDVDVHACTFEPVGDWHETWCLAPDASGPRGQCFYCGASEEHPATDQEATP